MTNFVREVTQSELELMELPQADGCWVPRSHGEILNLALSAISTAGLQIERMRLLTMKNAQRFLGFLQTDNEVIPEKKLVVGIRNSIDKSLSQGLFYGIRDKDAEILLCSDLETRKHTTNAVEHFNKTIENLPQSAKEYISTTRGLLQFLLDSHMPEQEAESILLRAYEKDIISSHYLPDAIENWRKADKKNALALLSAIDGSLKRRALSNPRIYINQCIALRNFFEELYQTKIRMEDYQI